MWDVFISHAWEDKESIARPLADALSHVGIEVWYDEFTLTLGDSLRRSVDHGLANSKYGVVILSPNFFAKEWPQRELDGLATREISSGKIILPIWHQVTRRSIEHYSLVLADKLGVSTERGLNVVVHEILRVIRPETSPSIGVTRQFQILLNHIETNLAKGQYGEACQDAMEAVKRNPGSATALAIRARVYGRLSRYGESFRDTMEALKLEPRNVVALWIRSETYWNMGQLDDARQDATEVLRILGSKLTTAEDFLIRARCKRVHMLYKEVVQDATEALKLNPKNTEALRVRADIYETLGLYNEGLQDTRHWFRFV